MAAARPNLQNQESQRSLALIPPVLLAHTFVCVPSFLPILPLPLHCCGLEISAFPALHTLPVFPEQLSSRTGKCLSLREGTLFLGMPSQLGHAPVPSELSPALFLGRSRTFGASGLLNLAHTGSSSPDLAFHHRDPGGRAATHCYLSHLQKHRDNQHNDLVCSGNPITAGSVSLGWIFSAGSLSAEQWDRDRGTAAGAGSQPPGNVRVTR